MNFEAFHHYQEKYRVFLEEEEERRLAALENERRLPYVREALQADFPSIISLFTHLWPQYSLDESKVHQILVEEFLPMSSKRWFVAERGQKIVGAISLRIQNHLWCAGALLHVDELIVDPSVQRQGVGRLLMHTAERYAREKSCKKIELESGMQRTSAHEFYRALGYEDVAKYFSKDMNNSDMNNSVAGS